MELAILFLVLLNMFERKYIECPWVCAVATTVVINIVVILIEEGFL